MNVTKFEKGKWYRYIAAGEPQFSVMCCTRTTYNDNRAHCYGVFQHGNIWSSALVLTTAGGYAELSIDEVESRLIAYAKTIGFGAYCEHQKISGGTGKDAVGAQKHRTKETFHFYDGILCLNGYNILANGRWAPLIINTGVKTVPNPVIQAFTDAPTKHKYKVGDVVHLEQSKTYISYVCKIIEIAKTGIYGKYLELRSPAVFQNGVGYFDLGNYVHEYADLQHVNWLNACIAEECLVSPYSERPVKKEKVESSHPNKVEEVKSINKIYHGKISKLPVSDFKRGSRVRKGRENRSDGHSFRASKSRLVIGKANC